MTATLTLRELMSPGLITLPDSSTLRQAAEQMAGQDIGDVVVTRDGAPCGVVTDRDLVIRGLAEGTDPATTELGEICSRDLVTLPGDASPDQAVQLMRDRAIRRVLVTDHDDIVGVVTLGDLAVDRDPDSALADISSQRPNQ